MIDYQILFGLLGIASILGGLISAFVVHKLEDQRKKDERIFNSRREAYAQLAEIINYAFIRDNKVSTSDPNFIQKVNLELCPPLSKARILAGERLSYMLREFYDCEIAICNSVFEKKDTSVLT